MQQRAHYDSCPRCPDQILGRRVGFWAFGPIDWALGVSSGWARQWGNVSHQIYRIFHIRDADKELIRPAGIPPVRRRATTPLLIPLGLSRVLNNAFPGITFRCVVKCHFVFSDWFTFMHQFEACHAPSDCSAVNFVRVCNQNALSPNDITDWKAIFVYPAVEVLKFRSWPLSSNFRRIQVCFGLLHNAPPSDSRM